MDKPADPFEAFRVVRDNLRAEKKAKGHTEPKGNGADGDAANETIISGVPKRITSFAELNERFALLEAPSLPSVYINRRDVLPLTDADLRRRLECEVVETGKKDNLPVYVPAYKFWTGHGRRHSYRNIVFTNGRAPGDALNLYKGLGVAPCKGTIDRILAHINEVICASDIENNTAILNLLAWQIQNIGKPSRIVVVLITENQQAGKGIILQELMAKIYGPTGFVPQATDQILGRFNDAIRGRAFFFLDEVLFSGDRRAADAIFQPPPKSASKQKVFRSSNAPSRSIFGSPAIMKTPPISKKATRAIGS
jgi:hypothetical protein